MQIVPAHADEPRLKVRAPVERAERPEHLQENLLGQVLRLVVRADEPVRDVEDLPPVRLDDRIPRRLIAVGRALDDRFAGHRRFES